MSKLYSTQMLGLSASLSRFPLEGDWPNRADARSNVCGSTISLGLVLDGDGAVEKIGLQVTACAVGQSSAAILANAIEGKNTQEVSRAAKTLQQWLSGEAHLPDWPDIEILTPALEHKGRYGALMLPWRAALLALDKSDSAQALS